MVRVPDPGRLVELARSAFGLRLTEEEARSFAGLMEASIASYRRLDRLAEPSLPVKYPRTGGYRPGPEENP